MGREFRPEVKVIVHLTASPFLGGPERQMLGLATAMPQNYQSVFLCFMENGDARPFVEAVRQEGHEAVPLRANFPHILRAANEVARHLRQQQADVLLTHNYKPTIIGYLAARRAGVPIVAVSRGWTCATARVRMYEKLDRRFLHWVDHVVCVSEGQAVKVRDAGVPRERVTAIRNAIRTERFDVPDPGGRAILEQLFPVKPARIVLAVGRLSPEKGFSTLIESARLVVTGKPATGFALIGEGPLREELQRQIDQAGLRDCFVLAGFRGDVDQLMPHADLLVQSSYTEGLANVVLEAMAASVPVLATNVGGTGEVVLHGETGLLVPPGKPQLLAEAMLRMLGDSAALWHMGQAGRRRVIRQFTFQAQCEQYERLLTAVANHEPVRCCDESADA